MQDDVIEIKKNLISHLKRLHELFNMAHKGDHEFDGNELEEGYIKSFEALSIAEEL